MPAPIHPDYNFKVNHKKRDNHYSMNTAASYENMYGIGYMISGDRIIITPQKTVTVHPGTIQFIHKISYIVLLIFLRESMKILI